MSRYIDAENLKEQIEITFCDSYRLIQDIIEVIENSPTADVVEVVRCKDCIYKQNAQINRKEFLICPASGIEITDDDYAVIEKGKTNDLLRLYSL